MTGTPVSDPSVELDKCYRTASDEVRLVTAIEGEQITFAARGPRHFLNWHETAARKVLSRAGFAGEVVEEVPYFWEPRRAGALA